MKIIDTAQAMPTSGHFVLAWLEGSKIPMRALWADKFSLGVSAEQDPEWGEYCEEKDEYFCPAGWYEMNQHEESHWRVDGNVVAWCELPRLEAGAAPAAVAPRGEYPHEQMDAMALDRYKVVPSNASMLWSHAVVAGDGAQQLYVGREVECQNMARKFAGAFLDGAFAFHSMAAAPTAQAAPALEAPAAPALPAAYQGGMFATTPDGGTVTLRFSDASAGEQWFERLTDGFDAWAAAPQAPADLQAAPVAWMYQRHGWSGGALFLPAGQEADDLRVGRSNIMAPCPNHYGWTALYAAPQAPAATVAAAIPDAAYCALQYVEHALAAIANREELADGAFQPMDSIGKASKRAKAALTRLQSVAHHFSAAAEPAAPSTWAGPVRELMGHLSDVLGDEAFAKIDTTRWNAVSALIGGDQAAPAAPAVDALTPVQALLDVHAELLDANPYAYFELAYTRQTGWMAWITDKPFHGPVINPDRKVLARGQGDTPAAACAAAAQAKEGGAA